MKKILLLLIVLISINDAAFSQAKETTFVSLTKADSNYYSQANFFGTFQIIHHSKQSEIFSITMYTEIENKRKIDEVVLWEISPLTTIRIFPQNLIYPPLSYRIKETEIVELFDTN